MLEVGSHIYGGTSPDVDGPESSSPGAPAGGTVELTARGVADESMSS